MLSVAQAAMVGTAARVQESPWPQQKGLLHKKGAWSALTVHAPDGAQVPAVTGKPGGEQLGTGHGRAT